MADTSPNPEPWACTTCGKLNNPADSNCCECGQPKELTLLRADPHRWGQGKVHIVDTERDQTMCGQVPAKCPGTKFTGSEKEVTCKGCITSVESQERHAKVMAAYQQRQYERDEIRRQWFEHYGPYLNSETWHEKRYLVFKRARSICEGCGINRADQVHHLQYPQNCLPGSDQWIAQEKLFHLVAICDECHSDLHPDRDLTTTMTNH